MATKLTRKGQITIPKKIRMTLNLQPGCKVHFEVNDSGIITIQKTKVESVKNSKRKPGSCDDLNRFDNVRGRADIPWTTEGLMKLLRA